MIDYEDDETCLPLTGCRKWHRYNYGTHYNCELRKELRKRKKNNSNGNNN